MHIQGHVTLHLKIDYYHCVSVQEYTFGVLNKTPAMQLCEGYAKLWSFQQGQIDLIFTVKQSNIHHLVKGLVQL